MDETRMEDDDRDAIAAPPVSNTVPHPPRKAHSLNQTHRHPIGAEKRRQRHPRNHSLDEEQIYKNIGGYGDTTSSGEDDYNPFSSTYAPQAESFPGPASVSQKFDQSVTVEDEVLNVLPEVIAAGGGVGIFKVPTRAAVHPARPPCIELRPHPLKETQVGKFVRTMGCTKTQLWVGMECGVRVWDLDNIFQPGGGLGGRIRRGDEDAAPFHESVNTPPIHCLVVDSGNKLVWTGHKDGKIRSWKMEQKFDDNAPFKEGLSWQAHRGPVHAMIMTSYGDLWSGSENGVIKIWPWESIEKSLLLSSEERHMAALLVERSGVDLKSQVTVNGVCNISSQDVKCLLADNVRGKVWCANSASFSLWDARTGELRKVFNVEGLAENRVDMPSGQEQQGSSEDEMKVKFVSSSKKEKPQGFLQRSRNAIMGAADAVRRAATKGTGAFVVEDQKKTESLAITPDGTIWNGTGNGLIVQWDGNGNRIKDFTHYSCAVLCFCIVGAKVYVGYASGLIQVLDFEGNLIAGWVAHSSPLLKICVGTTYIYSMASHGGIRGWNLSSPGPIDSILRTEVAAKEAVYTRKDNIKIVIGTWNVAQGRPPLESIKLWLGSAASDAGIVVVGLQELEMGAGFLAMSAAKESVGSGLEGSTIGQNWLDAIGKALDEGTTFERMGSRQLAALAIALWVRKTIRTHVGDIDAGVVACGLGRTIGNKGGVGLRMRVYDRIMCFVNCHLAAHLEAVNRRNADFDHIYRNLSFRQQPNLLNNAAGSATSVTISRPTNVNNNNTQEESRPELADADLVAFLGDFNYRLHSISYDEARDFVSQRCFDWLREKDQLRAEMKAGKVFQGMREAVIRFPPTYKFEKHQPGLGGYDCGEKKRIPAWCDRIIYRDNKSVTVTECSLECPVVASVVLYEACMEVTDSDHKPVRCKMYVNIAHVDRSVRRQELGDIIYSNEQIRSIVDELKQVPEIAVSTDNIVLQNQETVTLRITNKSSKDKAVFHIICEGQSVVKEDGEPSELRPRGSFGFPRWLEVTPPAGVIESDRSIEVSVHHQEMQNTEETGNGVPQSWWSEDTRDKEVVLGISIQGSCSVESRIHQIRVRYSLSGKTAGRINSSKSSSSSKKIHTSSINRSEFGRLSNSSEEL
ncbi:unnamed protein product [Rhodiola kirilowii]